MEVELIICLGYDYFVTITVDGVWFKCEARRRLIEIFGQKWYDQIWYFDMKRLY